MSFEFVIEGGKTVRLTTAGKYCDRDIVVTAKGGAEPVLQEKSATPTKSAQTIEHDAGYDGLSKVEMGAIPDEYIIPSGSKTITENGTHDVAEFASVEVNVEAGGGGGELNMSNCVVTVKRPSGSTVYYGREMVLTNGTVQFVLDSSTSGSETRLNTRCDSVMYVLGSNVKTATYSAGEVLYTNSKGVAIKTPATAGATVTITIT